MEKTFEQAIEEIENIINELESKELTLKENIDKFKKGMELLNFCKKELEDTEMSIKKIINENGEIRIEEFEEDHTKN